MKKLIATPRSARGGFTLIELLLVLVILGILAGIVVPLYGGHTLRAKITAAVAQIATFKTTLASFEIDNGFFPSGRDGLQQLVQPKSDAPNWKGPYIPEIPLDPWQHPYVYEYPGKHHTFAFDISSAGPDGQPGTDDDITSWAVSPKP